MNKTVITIAFFVLVLFGMVGLVVVLVSAPASLTEYMSAVAIILAIASTAALNFGGVAKLTDGQAKQGETINTIQRQTNGTTTALTNQIAELVAHLANSAPAAPTPTTPITVQITDPDPGRHALITV